MATEKRLIAYDPITLESFTRSITKFLEPDACQYDMGYADAVERMEDWLEANTVDAVEVVHGRWESFHYGGYTCSNCGKRVALQGNYCHSCGAKMDGEGNG